MILSYLYGTILAKEDFIQKALSRCDKLWLGMGMCQHLDVFSHTQAQEKWKSQDNQIVSNTKDINTKISAIHHSCRLVSVATVIYSRAEIHLDSLTPSHTHTHSHTN